MPPRNRRLYDPSKHLNNNNSSKSDEQEVKKEELKVEDVKKENIPEIKPAEPQKVVEEEKEVVVAVEQPPVIEKVPVISQEEVKVEEPKIEEVQMEIPKAEEEKLEKELEQEIKKELAKKQPMVKKVTGKITKVEEKPHYIFGRDENGKPTRIMPEITKEEVNEDMYHANKKIAMLEKMFEEADNQVLRTQMELEIQQQLTKKANTPDQINIAHRKEDNLRDALANHIARQEAIVKLLNQYKENKR